jgi:hypothetical protein
VRLIPKDVAMKCEQEEASGLCGPVQACAGLFWAGLCNEDDKKLGPAPQLTDDTLRCVDASCQRSSSCGMCVFFYTRNT